jgi:hypothetical protein
MRPFAGAVLAVLLAFNAAYLPHAHAATRPKEAKKASVTVYVTDTGTKYHRAGCRYLKGSSHPISLEEARRRYEACKVCKPG